ncbi:MAG: polyhydroxyalkanoate synthesis repressor PhaR [Pseudomonadota bacterium]
MAASVRIIKKYPNRRLYDTFTSAYITLSDVKQLVLDSAIFKVVDAKTDEDLTRSILLQIILEEEAGGSPLFSAQMLSQIIRFYGDAMQGMMGAYLEKTMQAFLEIQSKFHEQSRSYYEGNALPTNPELWTQFMQVQAPMVQGMMSHYIDQSKQMFVQMQEQMQHQARSMWPGFPFPAATGMAPGASPANGTTRPTESPAASGRKNPV